MMRNMSDRLSRNRAIAAAEHAELKQLINTAVQNFKPQGKVGGLLGNG